MNAVTQLAEQQLEATLAHYAIGKLIRYWPAANGIENSNYFVQTDDNGRSREFVLTILEQASTASSAYAPMMQELDAAGLPVAPPITTLTGEHMAQATGKPALLQRRLSGQHAYNPTTKQVCSIARFVARMHLTMASSDIALPEYPRDPDWLNQRANMLRGYVPYTDQRLIEDTVVKCQALLERLDVRALPRGMIHGDLFRDNVLFDQWSLTGVLDFHHAASGYWVYDLAVIANDWCNDASGALDPERTRAMLRAYHKIRPLTSQELWYFGLFALYAALSFWLSRLAVAVDQRSAELLRFKNPDEFRRIVVQHNAHSFYLDERLLDI